MDYLELAVIVKQKTSKYQLSDDAVLSAIMEVEQVVKNYCAISEVPGALKYTLCNMAVDLLLYEYQSNTTPVEDALSGEVGATSIKVGDISIGLGDKGTADARTKALKSHRPNLDELALDYRAQLNQFRRLW